MPKTERPTAVVGAIEARKLLPCAVVVGFCNAGLAVNLETGGVHKKAAGGLHFAVDADGHRTAAADAFLQHADG